MKYPELIHRISCTFQKRKRFSLEDVGALIQGLMGDFYHPLYLRDSRYKRLNVADILFEKNYARSMDSLNTEDNLLDGTVSIFSNL